ncbi:hypothetical protein GOD64_28200 [Sinorhizobium medicae]|nr:hypothetical protein [Sinorhizobium medicae]
MLAEFKGIAQLNPIATVFQHRVASDPLAGVLPRRSNLAMTPAVHNVIGVLDAELNTEFSVHVVGGLARQ